MKLTKIALDAISGPSGLPLRLKLGLALNCSEGSINRYIRNNDDSLTKAAALKVIQDETGMSQEQLLELDPVELGVSENKTT